MKVTKMSNYNNFRKPTVGEIKSVSQSVKLYNDSQIKKSKICSTVFTVIGLLFMGSIGLNNGSASILSAFIGIFSFVLVFIFIRTKNRCKSEVIGFSDGEFQVIEGTVDKIETNIDTPGCVNIWFISSDGLFNRGWYRIRQENVEIGTPVILVYPSSVRTKNFLPRVYTPFMLTSDGMILHW